jgi:hypothetical protein
MCHRYIGLNSIFDITQADIPIFQDAHTNIQVGGGDGVIPLGARLVG